MSVIITTPLFWDCECEEDYIHFNALEVHCTRCLTRELDQPDSRINEVGQALFDDMRACLNEIAELGAMDSKGFAAGYQLQYAEALASRIQRIRVTLDNLPPGFELENIEIQ